jgi:hypothetical protein
MSFIQFASHINPKRFTCSLCGKHFTFGKNNMTILIALLILGVLLGVGAGFVSTSYEGISTIEALFAAVSIVLVIGIPVELYFWKSYDYEKLLPNQ